jgi:translation initiation factor IF-3
MGHPDAEPKLIGRNINVMLTPLPANKRKPKFYTRGQDEDIEEPETGGDQDEGDSSQPAQS